MSSSPREGSEKGGSERSFLSDLCCFQMWELALPVLARSPSQKPPAGGGGVCDPSDVLYYAMISYSIQYHNTLYYNIIPSLD